MARSLVNCEKAREMGDRSSTNWRTRFAVQVIVLLCLPAGALAAPADPSFSPTNIFAPVSTPAHSIFGLSLFALVVTAAPFVILFRFPVHFLLTFCTTPDHAPT